MPAPTNNQMQPRTLVLCFDGTANQFADDRNTNVVHLFAMLKRNDPDRQLVYYQTGIGTYTPAGVASGISQVFVQALDEAVAWYLEDHVLGGYKFLMQTYRTGDRICLFGFSRGAYTARALAGMLYRVGLLPMCNVEQVPFAYNIFKDSKKEGRYLKKDPTDPRGYLSSNFRTTFSREVTVEFVGLWDTVASVGFIPRSLPNTAKNPSVLHVRHAVSLDENRAKFKSNLWSAPAYDSCVITAGVDPKHVADEDKASVEEVWFAGGHGDIGGGWVPYNEPHALSRITLRWIVREATKCSSIVWEEDVLQRFRIRKPKEGTEEMAEYIELEKADALSRFHSAFGWTNIWWVLELLPLVMWVRWMGYHIQIIWPNLFGPRTIRKPTEHWPTKVHSSVKTRLEHYRDFWGPYRSSARWDPKLTVFVDEWATPSNGPLYLKESSSGRLTSHCDR